VATFEIPEGRAVCGNCRFWEQKAGTGSSGPMGPNGQCCFGPPTPLFLGMMPPPKLAGINPQPQPVVLAFFPPTAAMCSCGQWQAIDVPPEPTEHIAVIDGNYFSQAEYEEIVKPQASPLEAIAEENRQALAERVEDEPVAKRAELRGHNMRRAGPGGKLWRCENCGLYEYELKDGCSGTKTS
jgi:hypothetical protein